MTTVDAMNCTSEKWKQGERVRTAQSTEEGVNLVWSMIIKDSDEDWIPQENRHSSVWLFCVN